MTRLAKLAIWMYVGVALTVLVGCSTTKHVPDGKLLLDHVTIHIDDSIGKSGIHSSELVNYLRQTPNHKTLGCLQLQLRTYSLSGRDSTKWYNRWLRRLGRPPVIYDDELTVASANQLRQAMVNRGYMDVSVNVDTVRRDVKKKIDVKYTITPRIPHYIASIEYDIADTMVSNLILRDSTLFTVHSGDLFDRNKLDAERALITERLRNNGYYAFTKEYITFIADTSAMSNDVALTMQVHPPRRMQTSEVNDSLSSTSHTVYRIRNVLFVTDYHPGEGLENFNFSATDTVRYNDITILYGDDHYLKPQTLYENCFIDRGDIYKSVQFDRTYEALGRLGILKSVNISLRPIAEIDGSTWLDAYVLLSRGKKQGVTFELEGTNSEGDLGFGLGLTYQHRNLAKGSELLTAKLRTSYESLSGNLDGLINDRYTEYAGEVGITFPKFMAPFLSRNFKRKVRATSEFAVSFNYQERPEYTRIIAGAGWKYKWGDRQNSTRRTFDLIDVSYVYLPHRTDDFLNQIAPTNPLLRYSYEDHFIMRMGFTLYKTNKRIPATGVLRNAILQPTIYTVRTAVESAGNLLYAISSAVGQHRSDGAYKIFGIQYAQYVKGEVDYMIARNYNQRSSLAFHVGFGLGVPYGNSRMLPFEKRFYAGGANGVRGWGVRTLGPGRYDSHNSVTDFINQCGDIRFDINLEYRAKLFWVLEGAAFIDAGNVWTIHNYETQPGGQFRFNSFYKEMAWAYGVGLRMDFTYFLLRLDLGMKAYNPALNQEAWPLIHPRWKRDSAFHFSVGYPF
jgi:outer membrane protein assembly factor BamA